MWASVSFEASMWTGATFRSRSLSRFSKAIGVALNFMGSFLQLGHGLADRRRDSEHIRGAGAHAILENVFRRIYYLALRVGSMEIASADGGEVGEGEGANLNLSVFHHFSLMPLLPWLLKRIAFTKPASHTATASAVVPFAYMATARA